MRNTTSTAAAVWLILLAVGCGVNSTSFCILVLPGSCFIIFIEVAASLCHADEIMVGVVNQSCYKPSHHMQ